MAQRKMETLQLSVSAESGSAGAGGRGGPAGRPTSSEVCSGRFSSAASAPRSASAARTARVGRFSELRATSEAAKGITRAGPQLCGNTWRARALNSGIERRGTFDGRGLPSVRWCWRTEGPASSCICIS